MKNKELFETLNAEIGLAMAIIVYDHYMGCASVFLIPLLETLDDDQLDEIVSYSLPHSTLEDTVNFVIEKRLDPAVFRALDVEEGIKIFHDLIYTDGEEHVIPLIDLTEDIEPVGQYQVEKGISRVLAELAENDFIIDKPSVETESYNEDQLIGIYLRTITQIDAAETSIDTTNLEELAASTLKQIANVFVST